MRKKIIISLTLLSLFTVQLWAGRAYPRPKEVRQTDGTSLTLVGHGDEFRHYVTTTDGYTVVRDTEGTYRYAVVEGDRIRVSDILSHNESERTPAEASFLKSVPKHLSNPTSATGMRLKQLSARSDSYFSPASTHRIAGKKIAGASSSEPYRGLVILVNFQDRKFSRGDAANRLVDEMMNGENRTFYNDPLLNGSISCTGSVKDYFTDNSGGQFIPEFDVVGPIEVPMSQYYINGTENTYELCREVLLHSDAQINFSRYDCDKNGEVDMVYILYAGYASLYQGNDERLVWPHAGHFADSEQELILDNTRIGRFACSAELFGWHDEPQSYLDGIGVIVHEFSHVLGFKDHYDVSGYLNEDPGSWDVMASGSYNGILNDTPCGYSSYEKHAAGFIIPQTLKIKDDGTTMDLRPLSSYGEAFRIESMQDSTVFLLENRQPEKWDAPLPGHGMLVWRVDSCDSHYWDHNALNVNNRLHLKLVRANGPTLNLFREMEDTDYDPFPGTRNATSLSNYTKESNLLTDLNYPSPIVLKEITETDGIISFGIEIDADADRRPYTFRLSDRYSAHGILLDEDEQEADWVVTSKTVAAGNTEREMICNLVPDTRNITSTDPKYEDGFSAPYFISTDKKSIIIEPCRVATNDNTGIWLVDFTDLERGGSGAIRLNMDPYGSLSLADSESIIGYCTMPKTNVVVDPIAILERFSLVKSLTFTDLSSVSVVLPEITPTDRIFNLQGIEIEKPMKGEIYIVNGEKHLYR